MITNGFRLSRIEKAISKQGNTLSDLSHLTDEELDQQIAFLEKECGPGPEPKNLARAVALLEKEINGPGLNSKDLKELEKVYPEYYNVFFKGKK